MTSYDEAERRYPWPQLHHNVVFRWVPSWRHWSVTIDDTELCRRSNLNDAYRLARDAIRGTPGLKDADLGDAPTSPSPPEGRHLTREEEAALNRALRRGTTHARPLPANTVAVPRETLERIRKAVNETSGWTVEGQEADALLAEIDRLLRGGSND